MRRAITEAFGAAVVEHDGSRELGTIAWQCRETGGFHIADASVIVEVLGRLPRRDRAPDGGLRVLEAPSQRLSWRGVAELLRLAARVRTLRQTLAMLA